MYRTLFFLFSICFYSSSFANQTPELEISQKSELSIYESKLECQKVLSTGSFQNCRLKLFYEEKPVKNTEIFINGGMPDHQHGLPTTPQIVWSDDKNVYLIQGLKFSMLGQWSLNFKVNAADDALKDQINFSLKVD